MISLIAPRYFSGAGIAIFPQLADTIRRTMTPELQDEQKCGSLSPVFRQSEKVGTASPKLQEGLLVPGDKILSKLSYSHIELLLGIDELLKLIYLTRKILQNIPQNGHLFLSKADKDSC